MRFLPLPLDEALGRILGHNVTGADGRRRLRKGRSLTEEDLEVLRRLGRRQVYVAELEDGDVREDAAADAIAALVFGPGLRRHEASTGRVNAYAESLGLLRLDPERLLELNLVEGVHLAARGENAVVQGSQIAATLKIVPYALPLSSLERARELCADPLMRLEALPERRVALVLTGSPGSRERVVESFRQALEPRLQKLGSRLVDTAFVAVDDDEGEARLAEVVASLRDRVDTLIVAGETAIMDRADITPRAIERAGGEVVSYGAPVDPGNLLLVARLGEVAVLGAPGCARSPKANIVDLVLPRLLAGDRLSRRDIARLGTSGLLDEVAERPMPRRKAG